MLRSVRSSHIVLADQALVSGAGFVTGVLIGRSLGISAFGIYTIGVMAWLFSQMCHSSLITSPMMTLVPSLDASEQTRTYVQLAWINSVSCLLLAILAAGALKLTDLWVPSWEIGDQWWIWGLTIYASLNQEFVRKIAFTQLKPEIALMSDICRFLGQIIGLLSLAITDQISLERAVATLGVFSALGCLIQFRWLVPTRVRLGAIKSLLQQYWLFGRWLLGSSLIQWGSTNVFFIVSGALIGTAAIGALRAATQLAQPLHVLMLALENRVPIIAAQELKRSGSQAMHRYISSIWRRGALPILTVAIGVSSCATFLLGHIYGPDFKPYAVLVAWACLTAAIRFIAGPLTAGLRALDNTRAIFKSNLTILVSTIVTTYPVIVTWGVTGAAAGMAITCASMAAVLIYDYKKSLRLSRLTEH